MYWNKNSQDFMTINTLISSRIVSLSGDGGREVRKNAIVTILKEISEWSLMDELWLIKAYSLWCSFKHH